MTDVKIHPIQDGVPLPTDRVKGKYRFDELAVGQSRYYETKYINEQKSIGTAAWHYANTHGWKIVRRRDDAGIRVWRVK